MVNKSLVVFFWACLIGTAALAAAERQTRIEIAVDDDASGERAFVFDSEAAGFDLHSLAPGESRLLTDEAGATATVRRTAEGFEFDVDGKTINVGDIAETGGMHHVEMELDGADAEIETVKKVKIIKTGDAHAITVISEQEIDPATRTRVREALQAGGHDDEILFLDGSQLGSDEQGLADRRHEVRVIRKEIEVTN
jgi:hypothetical protein